MAQDGLKNFNILIVDADMMLGSVLKSTLEHMGFPSVQATTNGRQAFEALQQTPVDFMITEWNTREFDGLELLNRIRRDRQSQDHTLPIIMLTGRAEKEDVLTARDYGINEYVIKPFTANTIYSRLERLIETPRSFVLSHYYIGPDRRNSRSGGLPPRGMEERRHIHLHAVAKPPGAEAEPFAGDSAPKLWLPDYKLKNKLGSETSLSSVITPDILADAQHTIEAAAGESVNWLNENLDQLKQLQAKMAHGDFYTLLPVDMSDTALTMSARSGTFGYASASKVAYLLHMFCRNHLRVEDPNHQLVAEKHIAALQVTLQTPKTGETLSQDHEIIRELRNLSEKYAA